MSIVKQSNRSLKRRSKRYLLWLIVGIVLCQTGLALSVEFFLPHVRDPEFTQKIGFLRQRITESPQKPLVLIIGSSRSALGFDAKSLTDSIPEKRATVFNMAMMGSGPMLHFVTLQRLLEEGIRPKLLYVEIMPAMLAKSDDGRLLEDEMLDGARLQSHELRAVCNYCEQTSHIVRRWMLGRILPSYRHQAEFREQFGLDKTATQTAIPILRGVDSHGWRIPMGDATEDFRQATSSLMVRQYRPFCCSAEMAGPPICGLMSFFQICHDKEISVRVVLMPEATAFRKLYTKQSEQAMIAEIQRMRKRFGLTIVDARSWIRDDRFWDTQHLMLPGARDFTRRFLREELIPTLDKMGI